MDSAQESIQDIILGNKTCAQTDYTVSPRIRITVTGNGGNTDELVLIKHVRAFMRDLTCFYLKRNMLPSDLRMFYDKPLDCYNLWMTVVSLGGYEKVTEFKLWYKIAEVLELSKTCIDPSETFRNIYEMTLKEFEKRKNYLGELELPSSAQAHSINVQKTNNKPTPESTTTIGKVTEEVLDSTSPTFESGRVKRKAATRSREIWQTSFQNLKLGSSKRKVVASSKEEGIENLQSNLPTSNLGIVQRKTVASGELPAQNSIRVKRKAAARSRENWQTSLNLNLDSHIRNKSIDLQEVDKLEDLSNRMVVYNIGSQAYWVKFSAQETDGSYMIYALIPGLLREELQIQTDQLGRLIIMGNPEKPNNPWGITCFKKVIILPKKTDPLRTTSTILLNGRVIISVPLSN